MPALWVYPWTLQEEGLETACVDIAGRGFDAINLAAQYHSCQTFEPRREGQRFYRFPGGCYFRPSEDRFAQLELDPIPNEIEGLDDPFREVADIAHDQGLDVNGWIVCYHNSRLARTNPSFRTESAFGDPHDHSVCPSHPEVQSYFEAVVEALVSRGADQIQLERIGYPPAFHRHGWEFGHDKRQVLTTTSEQWLISQCFCDGCRAAASDRDVNFDRAQNRVRSLLDEAFEHPGDSLPSVSVLTEAYPELRQLIEFRQSVVDGFLEKMAASSGDAELNYYLMEWPGFPLETLWVTGIDFASLEAHLDRVKALCYVNDPEAAVDRIVSVERTMSLPVDVGVTLDRRVIDGKSAFESVVAAARERIDGDVSIYHHSIATEAQLDWASEAIR